MELYSAGVTARPAVEVTQCEFSQYKLIYRKIIAPSSASMILIVSEQGRWSNVLDKCNPQMINKSVM